MALKRAPLEYNRTWQMRLWLFGVFFFLYAPLVCLIAFSLLGYRETKGTASNRRQRYLFVCCSTAESTM